LASERAGSHDSGDCFSRKAIISRSRLKVTGRAATIYEKILQKVLDWALLLWRL
jgi:hypothetical protein